MKRHWLLFSQVVTVLVAVWFVLVTLKPEWVNRRPASAGNVTLFEAATGATGEVMPGTPQGAPAGHVVGRKARLTTYVTVLLWAVIAGIIQSGVISIEDIDMRGVMAPSGQTP